MKVAIVGGSGYTGAELIRLLNGHPEAEITTVTSETYEGKKVSDVYPMLTGAVELAFIKYSPKATAGADVVFVALPHGEAMKAIPDLVKEGSAVIDLSGDFRLEDAALYEQWYGLKHVAPSLLDQAVYGLTELNREQISGAKLISNPGCYPTASILGLAPLLNAGLVFAQDIIIDAQSGVSGAGRKANETTHFCAADENITAYKAGGAHQHIPEMELYMGKVAGEEVRISFTPHLAPLSRGIYATIYADLKEDANTDSMLQLYKDFYQDSYFVKVMEAGSYPQLKAVQGSNYCHIGAVVDERCGRVVVTSAIDNLVKGASGQAIQNMNVALGLPEETGLTMLGLYP